MVGTFPALSETFVLNQITGLIERGHSVSIFAERASRDREVHPDVDRFGLRDLTRYEELPERFSDRLMRLPQAWRARMPFLRALNVFRFGGTAASLRLAWSVGLVDGASDFDIVQCHFGALGLKAALLREIGALRGRIVTAFHGEDITNYPRQFPGNVYEPLFAHGDLFLPISARWNDSLTAMGCPADRIRVHRMGVDLRHFSSRPPDLGRDGPLRIISVARLVEKKGIADAIRAVAGLDADYEYVIVGDGPLRAELESLARTSGVADRVRFTGSLARTAVAELLRSAAVCLAPSVTAADGDIEGIPVSIMEAMAVGLPVVSTRHSAIDELVEDGISGFLAAEHDVPALTRSLAALAADPALRARMGAAGHAIIAREFDAGVLAGRLEELYGALIQSPVRQIA
jgi:colanic acid/amylovoran biosynthesis glycosyltransferase